LYWPKCVLRRWSRRSEMCVTSSEKAMLLTLIDTCTGIVRMCTSVLWCTVDHEEIWAPIFNVCPNGVRFRHKKKALTFNETVNCLLLLQVCHESSRILFSFVRRREYIWLVIKVKHLAQESFKYGWEAEMCCAQSVGASRYLDGTSRRFAGKSSSCTLPVEGRCLGYLNVLSPRVPCRILQKFCWGRWKVVICERELDRTCK
jgi:hypothetical protein